MKTKLKKETFKHDVAIITDQEWVDNNIKKNNWELKIKYKY